MSNRKIIATLLVSAGLLLAAPALAAPKNKAPVKTPAPAAAPAATAASGKAAPPAEAAANPAAAPAQPSTETTDAAAASPKPEASATTQPAADEEQITRQDWPFQGAFGTYDRAALQRGFQVYKQVCSACHSMNLLSYRNLEEIGYTEGQVKAIAADYQVNDINDDTGEIIQRPAKPSDRFHPPFPNKQASMAANNGAYPPDMSLLAKAREGGPDYIYSILTGFADFPPGFKHSPTQYYNKAMKGHIIAMPPPLSMDGQVQYENAPGIPQTKEQYAKDVAQFLTWASEPHMEERKQTGTKVFLFMLAFCFIAYNVKKKVWRDVH
jgi:ubiquinol-cytochrome c reductase cytochrome c1 subunit